MDNRHLQKFRHFMGSLKLNRKIQLLLILIIVPIFIIFVLTFISIYGYNQQYDRVIANASEARRFSINFKEDFDNKVFHFIAGHAGITEDNLYKDIEEASEITEDLVSNTGIEGNKHRAESILRLLKNLEKYVKRIEENKKAGGHYDENIDIWNNDVQLVTGLIQTNLLEYIYYEASGMELVRSKVSESLGKITVFSLIVFAALVFAALFLSFVIPNSIVKPINHLNDITNQVAKGDLTVRADILYGGEVAELGNSLNIMIEKIENLLEMVKIDEANLREAELELLQSQINPHFLYNTLDTIMWLAESGNKSMVVEMVGALSDFFRTSLSHGNGMVTLGEEERHVRSYLMIQQVRYQDILEYDIDIPENIKEVIIPKITIQPLVENALYHGIKNRRGKGSILVKAQREQDEVVISITDNGIGMTSEQLSRIVSRFDRRTINEEDTSRHESYGIFNVNERIRLKFGEKYGLSISSEYGRGTCVKVKIPYL